MKCDECNQECELPPCEECDCCIECCDCDDGDDFIDDDESGIPPDNDE